jgi:2-polyprenyl-6-methoxyphenol hydroxylase-like FAD-dependent oxidoreductase
MNEIDVLIVGAGPTGLVMAIECRRYGLSFRIIDKSPSPSTYSKAAAVQSRTLEIFQRIGVLEPFLNQGVKVKAGNIHLGNKNSTRISFDKIESPFPYVLGIGQDTTEQILSNFLELNKGKIERGVTVLEIEERGEFIYAKTDIGVIKASYLVGCDGAHSIVRKSLQCSFKGKTFTDVFSLADVKIKWRYPHDELQAFLGKSSLAAAIPLPGEGRYRLIFQLKRLRNRCKKSTQEEIEHGLIESNELKIPTLAEIETTLSSLVKDAVKISDPKWVANFRINSRLSNRYRKGRIFLAGDAAHIHSPVGGQGMNTGIQDAFNLAWKIAYTTGHLIENKNLLDSYEKERHILGKKLLKNTERASNIITIHRQPLLFLRKIFASLILSFECVRKKITEAISETTIGYPQKRMKNIKVIENNKVIDYFIASEKTTKYHLILFNHEKSPIHHSQIEIFHAVDSTTTKAILVRPDGYIALEDKPPFHKLKRYFE